VGLSDAIVRALQGVGSGGGAGASSFFGSSPIGFGDRPGGKKPKSLMEIMPLLDAIGTPGDENSQLASGITDILTELQTRSKALEDQAKASRAHQQAIESQIAMSLRNPPKRQNDQPSLVEGILAAIGLGAGGRTGANVVSNYFGLKEQKANRDYADMQANWQAGLQDLIRQSSLGARDTQDLQRQIEGLQGDITGARIKGIDFALEDARNAQNNRLRQMEIDRLEKKANEDRQARVNIAMAKGRADLAKTEFPSKEAYASAMFEATMPFGADEAAEVYSRVMSSNWKPRASTVEALARAEKLGFDQQEAMTMLPLLMDEKMAATELKRAEAGKVKELLPYQVRSLQATARALNVLARYRDVETNQALYDLANSPIKDEADLLAKVNNAMDTLSTSHRVGTDPKFGDPIMQTMDQSNPQGAAQLRSLIDTLMKAKGYVQTLDISTGFPVVKWEKKASDKGRVILGDLPVMPNPKHPKSQKGESLSPVRPRIKGQIKVGSDGRQWKQNPDGTLSPVIGSDGRQWKQNPDGTLSPVK